MITLQETIVVERDIQACFDYLLDFSTVEQWDPGVYRARKLTPGRPVPDSRFEVILNTPSGKQTMHYRLLLADQPCLIRLQGEAAGFSAMDTIRLSEPCPGLTRIDYRAELEFSRLSGLSQTLLRPWLRRIGRKAVAGLATALSDPQPRLHPAPLQRLGHRLLWPAMRQFTETGYLQMPNKGLSQRMDGKTVLITGATSGLGLATACQLARQGANLILLGREPARQQHAREQIMAFSGCSRTKVSLYHADLSSAEDITRACTAIKVEQPRIDVLINNAGALFNQRALTPDGVEQGLAINLLAPYRITETLLPRLRTCRARVINVASGGMYLQGLNPDDLQSIRAPYNGAKAYARHKRALVDLTRHWTRHPANRDVRFYSMHPGWAATPGVRKALPRFNRLLNTRLRTPQMGADTICWLASTNSLQAEHNGQLWFDRQPQLTEILPGTAVTAAQRQQLLAQLDALTSTG